MATTIDSLQLEIQSNSTSAASGIDGLAKALKKLSKNSDVNEAVTSLNNLRKSLHAFVNMPSNASKIDSLAKSLKSLSKVGKINIGDSLSSVKRSMESLGAIDVDGVAPQIERIASALGPLRGVNGSGFNNMMNGLKKLGDVADSLDDDTITRFVTKVKKLDAELGPLSTKMTAVASAFKAADSSALKAGDGFRSFRTHVSATALNLTSFIDVAKNAAASVQQIVDFFIRIIEPAIEWEGIAARFGRGFGENASEVYSWIQRLNKEMGINTQQFMQYSSVFATMLQGFGVGLEDSSKMALGYTELVYDIWAGYNDVYKSFGEAAEAVKSAIAGEVEPVRRAGFTIVEATLEQTAANHGLKISLENATEAQKSYLRYLTLVDQAHAQNLVGTYAAELNTAEGQMRTFSQQLKSLSQTFGSVFLPVLVKIMPWIQAFISLVNNAIIAVARFFGITIQAVSFGKVSSGMDNVAKSAGAAGGAMGSAAKAAKELKNATLGFDELNVISPPDDTGSGGGGGGGGGAADWDVDSLWDESIFDQIQSRVDEIKEKIKGLIPVAGGIAAAFAGWNVLKLLDNLDEADIKLGKMEPTIKNLAKGLVIAGISVAVGKLVWDFTGAYLEGGNKADLLKALGTTALGVALAGFLAGAPGAGIVLAVSGIVSLSRLVVELKEGTVEISDPEAITTGIIGSVSTVIGGAITWKALGPTITGAIKGLLGSASLAKIGTTIGGALSSGWGAITGALAAVPVWGWIAAAVVALIGGAIGLAAVDYDFTDVGRKIGEGVGKACRWLVDKKEAVDQWAKDVDAAITKAMNNAIKYFTEDFSWDKLIRDLADGLADIERWKNDFIDAGRDIVDGVIVGIEEGWENFCGNIGEFFTGLSEGFKEAFGIHSPAKKMMFIGQSIVDGVTYYLTPDSLKEKLSTMWTNANNWWNKSKKEFKEYTPSIGDIAANVSNAWDDAQDWWDRSKKALATYTPSIGDIKAKLSSAWTTAKNWWDRSKPALAAYTPSIGSIKDKLSSAWTAAKNWWDDSKSALSSVYVAVPSIKDKLVSAWNTAKDWWDRNVRLSIPDLSFKVTYTTQGLGTLKQAIVDALNLPGWPKLSFAKDGGMFDAGSLIWAGEAGAEVVANAGGGRTGVMNVQQMQEAVYEGVYSAVVSAMRANAGDGSQNVNVYLDGKQITAAVEKRQRERGASLMTGGMAYGF